jgi:hypothetical protein
MALIAQPPMLWPVLMATVELTSTTVLLLA